MSSILIFGCTLFFLNGTATAQEPEAIPISEQSTSALLGTVRDLLEKVQSEQAIPYLQEILVRLDGLTDASTVNTRATCMYHLGMCYLQMQKFPEAVELFKTFVQTYPDDKAALMARFLILEAYAWQSDTRPMKDYIEQLKASGEMDRLLSVFSDSKNSDTYRHAALLLVTAYARSADLENVQRFLPYCDTPARSDVGLNVALMEGGDLVFEQKDYIHALELYRMVQLSGELKVAYDQRLKALKDELSKPPPWVPLAQREAQKAGREDDQVRYEQMLKERQELDVRNYDLELMIRMARCYEAMDRNWPAYLIFKHIYAGFPENPLAEQCRYFAFQSLISLKEQEVAKAEGYACMKLYPQGIFHDELTLSLMNLHLAMNEADKAETLGKELLAQQPPHRFADQVSYLLGYVKFEQQNYEAALELFSNAAEKWPSGVYAQESVYWTGMCNLFLERFDEAIAVFEGYLNNPVWEKKEFAEDAMYRLGMAFRGKGDAAESEKTFRRFLVQFPESNLRSDVLSLTGDLRGAGGDLNAELDYYRQARDCAVGTEQKTRAVVQMAQVYTLQKNYAGVIALMEEYLATADSKGDFAGAGRWMIESCKTPDDCDKTLDACGKIFAKYGNDPQLESVDLLIEALANEKPDVKRDGAFAKRMKSRLAGDREAACRDNAKKTLCLRMNALFAGASEGSDREVYVNAILGEKDMTAFSPFLLLLFARESAARSDMDRVQAAYGQFRHAFFSSELMPDMANIETSVLLSAGRYEEALKMAQENLQKVSGNPKEGLTQKLAADALRLMKDYDGAVEQYNRFLPVREWRGPLTPQVIYWIGICRYEQGRFEEAFAFFQRVYVLYGGHTEWTSKAYEGSANCLRKLGRQPELIKTLKEMVSNAEVAATPEGRRAQAELEASR
ncbi:MAG: tetratricopeptide repeat protein [Kiritimatiellaceae bacterium]|nr:tetratricopeptide repeat protein [Kiritimatiellaceae bacterium]